jgi:hypothetical protein
VAGTVSGALIVTAELAAADFAHFEGLRRAHYPPERNFVPAHLTMFHALPPSSEADVRRQLSLHAVAPAPVAMLEAPFNLGNGVAFRVHSHDLEAIRDDLADHFHGCLTAQDAQGWRAHVTVQNKVAAREAKELLNALLRDFRPRRLAIAGLALHRYLGGPWQMLGRFPFRGVG